MTDKHTGAELPEKEPSTADASETSDPAASEEKSPNNLTPEEQMARYEESLKEDDWGHQPC